MSASRRTYNEIDFPAVSRVVRELKRRIATGAFPPGRYLPPERQLCTELESARGTLRKALAILADEGLIERTFGRGSRVLSPLDRCGKNVIGVVYADTREAQAWPLEKWDILEGIQETLALRGQKYELVPSRMRNDPVSPDRPERQAVSADALADRYGALIFDQTFGYDDEILKLEAMKVPVVVANLEVDIEVTATWVDHRKAARHAVRTLVAFGHRRIALLTRPPNYLFYSHTRAGFEEGMREAGLTVDESLIAECDRTDALCAYFSARELLARRDRPSAIVAARDVLARGVCEAIEEAGLEVGGDVSVIGFDDLSWPAAEPILTTFRLPARELGVVAAEMLIERIVNGWRPPEKRELDAPFILRRSAGPLLRSRAQAAEPKQISAVRATT